MSLKDMCRLAFVPFAIFFLSIAVTYLTMGGVQLSQHTTVVKDNVTGFYSQSICEIATESALPYSETIGSKIAITTPPKWYKQLFTKIKMLSKGFLKNIGKINVIFKVFRIEPKQIRQNKTINDSSDVNATGVSQFDSYNDHLEMNIERLPLTPAQSHLLYQAHNRAVQSDEHIAQWAAETKLELSPHLAYRYYVSVDWNDKYNENSIDTAIVQTVRWRKEFGIGRIDTAALAPLVSRGLAYTSSAPDKRGRAVIYLNIGAYDSSVSSEDFLNLVMYTVERADRMSVQFGSGEFVTVIDFSGFSWTKCPPFAHVRQAIDLLRMHYPYRLAGLYMLNAGTAFTLLWRLVTPLLPKKAIQKTVVINKNDAVAVLDGLIGLPHLDESHGGLQKRVCEDTVQSYFDAGFWAR